MTRPAPAPRIRLDLRHPLPATVDAGAPFEIELVVESVADVDATVDIVGASWQLITDEGALLAAGQMPPLRRLTPDCDEYDPRKGAVDMRPMARLVLTAPATLGRHNLMLVLLPHVVDGQHFPEARLPLDLVTAAHGLSVTVWDNPTPVALGEEFALKVGARCTAGCNLAGHRVEIVDATGTVVVTAQLGAATWPGTAGLHWAEATLRAPLDTGLQRWTARLAVVDDDPAAGLPHAGAARAGFSFVTTRVPRHRVTVALRDGATGAPVEQAHLRFGPFQGFSDAKGVARFLLPDGDFTLVVTKANHEVPPRQISIAGDQDLVVEAIIHPEKDPYERYWKY